MKMSTSRKSTDESIVCKYSNMQTRRGFFALSTLSKCLCLLLCVVSTVQAQWVLDKPHAQVVKKFLIDCLDVDLYSCFAEKLSKAVDKGMDWDIPVFNGITLKRNSVVRKNDTGRHLSGINKLHDKVLSFIEAHTVTIDFTSVLTDVEDDEEESATARRGGGKKKISKKERKYVQYALFVLLGIFGLTVPVTLKTLGLIAGKALIAAKVALIMLGSIALKKIFQADHHHPVKVHTHTVPIQEDEHDRFDYGSYKFTAYTKPPAPYNYI